ncbi:metallophosphoesterase [Sporosarcina aquimarina]|uniref:metallophosphoesterase n=1 Tax=Sporosarcina aquimarina TaxID=114975 RepID=UPI001C8D4159|nr:metallophosphoesterase [Sporosarcina aquimarina]MBY0223563.1 metallophosphoesterase [Sporosarcina aquimarina]
MNRMSKKFLYVVVTLAALGSFIYFQNNAIDITRTTIRSTNIPAGFDQFKIVQLSDLHNKSFGEEQRALVRKVSGLEPDIIVFTGDLIDSKKKGDKASLILMEELVQIAPVYFVSGNHEWWSGTFSSLESSLHDIGVQVMRNTHVTLVKGNEEIHLVGIDDPAYENESRSERDTSEEDILRSTEGLEKENTTLLLSHRPEMFSLYAEHEFDIVFAGHAHGGQFRIPFIGGLVAPNQGFLPKYTAGKYTLDHTVMVVSRGLGNSIIPLRVFNRPEIVAVTLEATDSEINK